MLIFKFDFLNVIKNIKYEHFTKIRTKLAMLVGINFVNISVWSQTCAQNDSESFYTYMVKKKYDIYLYILKYTKLYIFMSACPFKTLKPSPLT